MPPKEKLLGVDLEEFLEKHDLSREAFDKSALIATDLDAIARDHLAKKDELTRIANNVANTLQQVTNVHSVKSRVKSADSLVAKLIRKKAEDEQRVITLGNYEDEVRDLIGVRVLHLFKGQWKSVSVFTRKEWEELEPPVAYYRSGDSDEVIQDFQSAGLRTEMRPAGYRSVHHVISSSPSKKAHPVEIQIRTVFEEAWAEIDHIVRYPRKSDDPQLAGFLKLFNSFAGTADDMGTYLMTLREWLTDHKESVERERTRADKLQAQVAHLQISQSERNNLQKEIDALRAAQTDLRPPVFISTSTTPDFHGIKYLSTDAFKSPANAFLSAATISAPEPFIFPNSSELIKTCPNGHIFKASNPATSIFAGAAQCPTCKAQVF